MHKPALGWNTGHEEEPGEKAGRQKVCPRASLKGGFSSLDGGAIEGL